jgi:hypothetical protein
MLSAKIILLGLVLPFFHRLFTKCSYYRCPFKKIFDDLSRSWEQLEDSEWDPADGVRWAEEEEGA